MTDMETVREWLKTFPGYEALQALYIDYTQPAPGTAGLCPQGLTVLSRTRDILGNLTVENRYTFGLYCVFGKAPGDDAAALENEAWMEALQAWVQEQSALGLAPTFGDRPEGEHITAGGGRLYAADQEGVAIYQMVLTADFTRIYEA